MQLERDQVHCMYTFQSAGLQATTLGNPSCYGQCRSLFRSRPHLHIQGAGGMPPPEAVLEPLQQLLHSFLVLLLLPGCVGAGPAPLVMPALLLVANQPSLRPSHAVRMEPVQQPPALLVGGPCCFMLTQRRAGWRGLVLCREDAAGQVMACVAGR